MAAQLSKDIKNNSEFIEVSFNFSSIFWDIKAVYFLTITNKNRCVNHFS